MVTGTAPVLLPAPPEDAPATAQMHPAAGAAAAQAPEGGVGGVPSKTACANVTTLEDEEEQVV